MFKDVLKNANSTALYVDEADLSPPGSPVVDEWMNRLYEREMELQKEPGPSRQSPPPPTPAGMIIQEASFMEASEHTANFEPHIDMKASHWPFKSQFRRTTFIGRTIPKNLLQEQHETLNLPRSYVSKSHQYTSAGSIKKPSQMNDRSRQLRTIKFYFK